MADRKSIVVKEETYNRFCKWGKYSENMDDILRRLLRVAEEGARHSRAIYHDLDNIPASQDIFGKMREASESRGETT